MKIIKPQDFKSAFLQVVGPYEKQLAQLWRDPSPYTELMLGPKASKGTAEKTCILGKVAMTLGLKYYREYWYMDCIYYEEGKQDTKHFKKKYEFFAEYIAVAVEHEGYGKSSLSEMNKLSIWNTPLKVLITYCAKKEEDNLLEKYAEILVKADIFKRFSKYNRHLVIFGFKESETKLSWKFYTFNGAGFDKL